jgi:hypothetical protein
MAISASLAHARRTTLTVCLCAALAASAAGAQPRGTLPGFHNANPTPQAQRVPFAPFAAVSNRSRSSGAHAPAVPGSTIPVTSCLDDGSDGTLRKAIQSASDGDTIDMTGLTCSLITLQSGALVSAVPNLALVGPGLDALTIDGNNADRVLTGTNLDIADVTIAHGVVLSVPVEAGCILASGDLSLTRTMVSSCLVVNGTTDGVGGAAVVLGNLTMHAATIANSKAAGAGKSAGGGAIVGGTANLYDSTISGNTADASQSGAYGGGLFVNGEAKVYASTLDGNNAHSAQGQARGGAVTVVGGIVLHHTGISNNTAKSDTGIAYGGGIQAKGAFDVSVLDESTISANTAHSDTNWAYGGGISSGIVTNPEQATVVIDRSTISGNTAESGCGSCYVKGGGVFAADSIASSYATIDGNQALCTDASSSCDAIGGGLGIYGVLPTSAVTLQNVTISTNTATGGALGEGDGGGIVLGSAKPIVATNSTIAFNAATTAGGGIVGLSPPAAPSSLVSVIVSNNIDLGGPDDIAPGPFGMGQTTTIEGSSNLVVASSPSVMLPPGTLTDDPSLLPLTAGEGGSTAVHPLAPNSLAIDAGENPASLVCDQRELPYRRVYGPAADIGAYEYQGEPHLFTDGFDGTNRCQ